MWTKRRKKKHLPIRKRKKKTENEKQKKLIQTATVEPSLRILDMISMYTTTLCAVSMKKQITTASQAPAITIKIPLTVNFKIKKTTTRLTSSLGQGTQTPLSFDGLFP